MMLSWRTRGLAGQLSLLAIVLFCFWTLVTDVSAQQNAPCDIDHPCKVGCCSSSGQCGFTEDHCGVGCVSNCNATAECGQYALEDAFDCPINVCCR